MSSASRPAPLRLGLTAGVFLVLCGIAIWAAPNATVDPDTGDAQSYLWYSVVPPLLAVCLAVATQRIMVSLTAAVLSGGLLVAVPGNPTSPMAWAHGIANGFIYAWKSMSDTTDMQLLAFVVLIMAMIGVITAAGGMQGLVLQLQRIAKTSRSTQIATALLGLAIFIDDYANTMIVGSAMRTVSDARRISREKLAFLVDATSAPIAGLAIISTWVGYEVGLFAQQGETLGITGDGYAMFLDAIPFRFYCILMIGFVLANVLTGRDFGPMRAAQRRALDTGDVMAPDAVPLTSRTFAAASADPNARPAALTAVVPIASVFVVFLVAVWFDGANGRSEDASPLGWLSPGVWRATVSASYNSILLLAVAAASGVVIAWLLGGILGRVGARVMGTATLHGMRTSILPMAILILAWSLKEACDVLGTAPFLVAAVGDAVPAVLFPTVTFLIACVTAFATGTSFGTMAILIPTATPIAFQLDGSAYGITTVLTLAAVLDGAIFGDHCSPISDTTIMSSISSSCDHMHHVRTQLPYSMTVAAFALFGGYLPAAFGMPAGLSLVLSLVGIIVVLLLFGRPTDATAPGAS